MSTSALSWRLPSSMADSVPRIQSSNLPSGQLTGDMTHISTRTTGAKKPPMLTPHLQQEVHRVY
jgi:hypothetical protein